MRRLLLVRVQRRWAGSGQFASARIDDLTHHKIHKKKHLYLFQIGVFEPRFETGNRVAEMGSGWAAKVLPGPPDATVLRLLLEHPTYIGRVEAQVELSGQGG